MQGRCLLVIFFHAIRSGQLIFARPISHFDPWVCPHSREPENRGNAMDEMQSLQFLMVFMCAIAGVLVAGTGMVIYLLYRLERNAHVPRVNRPPHGLQALLNRR